MRAAPVITSKAVQFDSYGGIDVLEVREVPRGNLVIGSRLAG